MHVFLFLCIFGIATVQAQNRRFHSPTEKFAFAGHLYCTGQYYRAVEELIPIAVGDSVHYLLGQCYLALDNISATLNELHAIKDRNLQSGLVQNCARQLLVSNSKQLLFSELFADKNRFHSPAMLPVQISYRFLFEEYLPDTTQLKESPAAFRNFLLQQHVKREHGQYNPLLAAGLSAVVPGLGKIYAKKYEEGAFSFLLTGLFTYLTLQNIRHHHATRAWITGSSALLFYGGSIVGSYASAVLATQQEQKSIESETIHFMKENNSFLPAEKAVVPCR